MFLVEILEFGTSSVSLLMALAAAFSFFLVFFGYQLKLETEI